MRIGIDARLAFYRWGMGNYVYNLLKSLAGLDRENEYVLYLHRKDRKGEVPCPVKSIKRVVVPSNYVLREQLALPLAAARDGVDLLHCPANTAPILLPSRVRLVLTLHDVMFLLPYEIIPRSPSLYQRLGRLYRSWVVPLVARRARSIITVSRYSRKDILRLLRIPADRVTVTYEAADEAYRPLNGDMLPAVKERYGIDGDFILCLGGIDPRKNTASLIEVFHNLRTEADIKHKLVVVGLGWGKEPAFRDVVAKWGLEREVIFTRYVPQEDLLALYNAADVFVYPSLYEGFGLPVLEAMSCGTPVVTSRVSAVPEIAGEAALLVDPRDQRDMEGAILRAIRDAELRQTLKEKGLRRAKRFSWERAARETLRVYGQVFERETL